jgi:DNA-binding GntR family transcriptional regulator
MSEETLKYREIAAILRARIKNGVYGTQGRLPTVSQLVVEFHAGRGTVNQALIVLQSEGLVSSRHKSYMVGEAPMRITGAPFFDSYMQSQGLTPVAKTLLSSEMVPMPARAIAHFKDIGEDELFLYRRRLHGTKERMYRLADLWYPASLTEQFLTQVAANPDANIASLIRDTHDMHLQKASDDIIARLPTVEEAKILQIARNVPVLEIWRKCTTSEDKPVMYNKLVLVASLFHLNYQYDL